MTRRSLKPFHLILCLSLLWPIASARGAKDPTAPDFEAIRLAVEDLTTRFGDRYPDGPAYLERLGKIQAMAEGPERTEALGELRREALLANPLLDFEQILLIRRDEKGNGRGIRHSSPPIGLPQNWQSNASLVRDKWDNEIVLMTGFQAGQPKLRTIHEPELDVLITDLDLHFDGKKMLFSSLDDKRVWQIYEMDLATSRVRQVTPSDVGGDSFDACYLPSGDIVFACTATEQCVPCTGGKDPIANLFRMKADGTGIRRLCFDQDQNWNPVVSRQGTVLYSRWQYSDQAHFFVRVLMEMNPDGTNQSEHYGSGAYWPNSLFYVRPIPKESDRFVGIVSGHHGVPRMGEMVLFDTRLGRRGQIDPDGPAPGAVQRITQRGKTVRAQRADRLVDSSWPKFLYPYPLDGTYYLASSKPAKDAPWGVYLVDVFDNMVLLHQEPGKLLFEPVPVRSRKRPPVIPDRVDPGNPEATVYIADIYRGPGLAGVPRGTVKQLQIYTFDFPISYGFQQQSGFDVGLAGPWDLHAVLGRVPVEPDGSVSFTVPANTPISIQPLDAQGKALQLMRAWMTAMPGENLSCVGCHETPGTAPPAQQPAAFRRSPSKIKPWLNSPKSFDFRRDLQPMINRKCLGCHNEPAGGGKPDLRDLPMTPVDGFKSGRRMKFEDWSRSYYYLQRYVYRSGPESEVPMLMPMEHHADTSELVQMLRKGHHGLRLTEEQWDRLIVWIDLNVPFHGSWAETPGSRGQVATRIENRRELMLRYASRPWVVEPREVLPDSAVEFVGPPRAPAGPARVPELAGWPMDAQAAHRLQQQGPDPWRRTISFGDAGKLEMVWIPAGSFVMGSPDATPDERPLGVVKIDRGFWMSTTEVSNRDFRQFDPSHHSRTFAENGMGMVSPNDYKSLNSGAQPAVRVSWHQARAFCRWLSEGTGERFDLPTEAQWEWACRAGSDREFPEAPAERQGNIANCAGVTFGNFYDRRILSHRLFDPSWDDGREVTQNVQAYASNAWGLKNMHGNAAEWTRSLYKPYPYRDDDGRNDPEAKGKRVVRGGSFSDRPKRCTSSYRLGYRPWQGVYNVGFRVICYPQEEGDTRRADANP